MIECAIEDSISYAIFTFLVRTVYLVECRTANALGWFSRRSTNLIRKRPPLHMRSQYGVLPSFCLNVSGRSLGTQRPEVPEVQ